MSPTEAYSELVDRTRTASAIGSCASLLIWDEQTYMPPGGAEHRSRQLALLAGLQHERDTDPVIGELLATALQAESTADPEAPAAVNLREWQRHFRRQSRLQRSLVEEIARVSSLSQVAWLAARQQGEFALFQPMLERMVRLKREEGAAVSETADPYDGLLDEHEPGVTAKGLATMFETLRSDLAPLLAAIRGAGRKRSSGILRRDFDVQRLRLFSEDVATSLGFDLQRGRIDATVHPFFTPIGPGDCRIAVRMRAADFSDSFFGVLHETGHALYEQGLDPVHAGTPMGEAVSHGLHESQARLWENTVGRSRGFWQHFLPRARRVFPETLRGSKLDEFYAAVNCVEPTVIRVGADEVTYNLHIFVRFELERALISGELAARDVPAAWDEKYRHVLGLCASDCVAGCLQDAHWGEGLLGYFPTYTLGNIYAAQMFEQAERDLGNLNGPFAGGDFAPLLEWLREKVYRHGRRFASTKLIEKLTGRHSCHEPLVRALREKYSALYGL